MRQMYYDLMKKMNYPIKQILLTVVRMIVTSRRLQKKRELLEKGLVEVEDMKAARLATSPERARRSRERPSRTSASSLGARRTGPLGPTTSRS